MKLRKAQMSDAEMVLEWRNDEETRRNSFSKEIITLDSHMKWFEKKLSDPTCRMYILMDDDGIPVGNIRLDELEDYSEISYMISPAHRGKGYGKKILKLVEKEFKPANKPMVGLVEKTNIASQKCFETLGYTKSDEGNIYRYYKDIIS